MRSRVLAAAIVAIGIIGAAGPVSAEVTVAPSSAQNGARTAFTVELTNARAGVGTVKIELLVPDGVFAIDASPTEGDGFVPVVAYRDVVPPLVTPSGTVIARVVDKITWEGGPSVISGFFEVVFGLGPIYSEQSQFVFPIVQTYEDGSTDSWTELQAAGQPAPEYAAPIIALAGAPTALTPDPNASVPLDETVSTVGTAGLEVESAGESEGSPLFAILGVLAFAAVVIAGSVFAARRTARRHDL
jgi:uncharacterized protein YcnI